MLCVCVFAFFFRGGGLGIESSRRLGNAPSQVQLIVRIKEKKQTTAAATLKMGISCNVSRKNGHCIYEDKWRVGCMLWTR